MNLASNLTGIALAANDLKNLIRSKGGSPIPAAKTFTRISTPPISEIDYSKNFKVPSVGMEVLFHCPEEDQQYTYAEIIALQEIDGPTLLLWHYQVDGIIQKIYSVWLVKENLNELPGIDLYNAYYSLKQDPNSGIETGQVPIIKALKN
jgi:hypothetical protein